MYRARRKKAQEPDLEDLFAGLENLSIPELANLPPVKIKTLKQIQAEADHEREKQMEDRKHRYNSIKTAPLKFIHDGDFMSRSNRPVPPPPIPDPPIVNILHQDLVTYKRGMKFIEPSVEDAAPPPQSAYDRLYVPREKVGWKKAELAAFAKSSKILARFMDNRSMARIANVPKRIAKAEGVNLEMKRYNAEELKERVKQGEVDLFGFYNLVPHTLAKTAEAPIERKKKLMNRAHEMIYHFDYSNRPYQKEREEKYAEYKEVDDRLKEIDRLMAEIEERKRQRALKKKAAEEASGKPAKPSRKRKKREWEECFDQDADSWMLGVDNFWKREKKLIEKYSRLASEHLSDIAAKKKKESESKRKALDAKKKQEEDAKRKHEEEMKKKHDLEIRKKHDEENKKKRDEEMRKRRTDQEERERQREREAAATRLETEQRLKKEEEMKALMRKEVEEEEERMREELLAAEELRRAEERHRMAERKRLEEEEKKRFDAMELERLKRGIAATKEVVEKESSDAGVPAKVVRPPRPFVLQENYHFLAITLSKSYLEFRDKYFTHYGFNPDFAQRDLEHNEMMHRFDNLTKPLIIPQENNAKTSVTLLTMPIRKEPPKKVEAPKIAPTPSQIVASDQEIKASLESLKTLLKPRKHLNLDLSLYKNEIDYQKINVQDLKTSLVYPFRQSDGMYWPVFYGLPDSDRNLDYTEATKLHVQAYTKCNSFSGKYASYHLLTTTSVEDDDPEKRFEESYNDSDGDWSEYCRKPGRFSKRQGFKAKNCDSNEDFDVQKAKAVEQYKQDFDKETKRYEEFERYQREFAEDGDKKRYGQHLKVHLSELVRDFRLDIYSVRETFDGSYGQIDHPGTRESPLCNGWHNHGYIRSVKTRDEAFAMYMNDITREYQYLLPPIDEVDEFEDWCLTPMLASLYYQAYYNTFNIFPKDEMENLEARRGKYLALISKKRKIELKEFVSVCSMTMSDKQQWTFLLDQLVSHFREFPPLSQLMFKRDLDLHHCVQHAADQVMKTIQRDNANGWIKQ